MNRHQRRGLPQSGTWIALIIYPLLTLALVALLALLAGCSTGSIWLKNAQTGQVAECGPYFTPTHAWTTAGYSKLRDCVEDFQRQGYDRVSEPTR